MRKSDLKKGIYLLPNLCTTGNLFCGFYSVVKSLNGEFYQAAWAILFASIFDFLDGQVARMTRSQSNFGLEYDSLVDSASFGFAPAVLIYTWSLHSFPRVGWLVSFLFFACGVLRLARFNVQAVSVEKKDFQGLPIPSAASFLVGWILFYDNFLIATFDEKWITLMMTVTAAFLMVSTLCYKSLKGMVFRERHPFYALVAVVGILLLILLEPNLFVFTGAALYVLTGPAFYFYQKSKGKNVGATLRGRPEQGSHTGLPLQIVSHHKD
ncbi:MAG: CDP-diacylglycerol--serine O-phosphatidyltransferase [bacterium]|nr:CDP-diacylglycerol--serine O-phosphatidyltransferase [bacterium]